MRRRSSRRNCELPGEEERLGGRVHRHRLVARIVVGRVPVQPVEDMAKPHRLADQPGLLERERGREQGRPPSPRRHQAPRASRATRSKREAADEDLASDPSTVKRGSARPRRVACASSPRASRRAGPGPAFACRAAPGSLHRTETRMGNAPRAERIGEASRTASGVVRYCETRSQEENPPSNAVDYTGLSVPAEKKPDRMMRSLERVFAVRFPVYRGRRLPVRGTRRRGRGSNGFGRALPGRNAGICPLHEVEGPSDQSR